MDFKNLKRSINLVEAISIVIGLIIGSGIFLKPGIVLKNAGSPKMAVIAWLTGGIITLCSALSIAEIAANMPKTGGLYSYLEELYGNIWGFLLGWVQTVISFPGSCAALSIACAILTSYLIPLSNFQIKLLAVGLIAFLTIMNILSTKLGGVIQTIATIGKLIPIIVLIIFGLTNGKVNIYKSTGAISSSMGLGAAILGTLWAYDGWIGVTNVAEELKNPKRNLPRSIIVGVSFVIAIYIFFNAAIFKILPADKILSSSQPAVEASVVLFGEKASAFIIFGMIVSVFGALNGYLMTGARVPFAMAKRGQIPFYKIFLKSHSKFETPHNCLILQSLIADIYIFTGSFNTLSDLIVFVLWIFFVMGVCGIFILRKRKLNLSEYKVPLYPIVPLVGTAGGLYIIVSTIISNTKNSLIGIIITLFGLPVYFYLKKKKINKI
ncbi:APC family permease [Haloimpatiens sp. FM7315]|uniref:APC family permease n=1 Tax=Haloimpatiens sp. FM7315 TaxID=3298609 RepID=UPI00370B7073